MSKKNRDKAAFPRKIGGVKLPKHLRRAAARLVATAASPVGLELIAAGLALAAAAVEKERNRQRATIAVGNGADLDDRETIGSACASKAANDPHELGVAFGKMAEAALAGLFTRKG